MQLGIAAVFKNLVSEFMMLTGTLQIHVQGADRRCQVLYVHPEDTRQRADKFPVKWNDPSYGVSASLRQRIASHQPLSQGWEDVSPVQFEEQELGRSPRFYRFSLIADANAEGEAANGDTEPIQMVGIVNYVGLPTAPLPPKLDPTQIPAVSPAVAANAPGGQNKFRNPYNFIPTPPRRFADHPECWLGDGPPVSWDRLHGDLYSGTINVELTSVTPLLLSDPEHVSIDNHDHKTYARVTMDAQLKPRIDPTSLKGVLSSNYEVITHSRWRVFHKREQRLAKRMPANDGLAVVPFIARTDPRGRLFAHLMTGYRDELPRFDFDLNRWSTQRNQMLAAFVPNYGAVALPNVSRVTAADHGKQVWARIGLVRKQINRNAFFEHWIVLDWAEDEASLRTINDTVSWHNRVAPAADIHHVNGHLCVTNRNFGTKKYERFFFHNIDTQQTVVLSDDHGALNQLGRSWKEVIDSYRDAHTATDLNGNGPSNTDWSRHLLSDDQATLTDGTLGYVYLDRQGRAKALVPVHIARHPFANSPLDQLHPSLRPAASRDELSAADRVFGWVSQNGPGSHRGQLRIVDVRCTADGNTAITRHNPPVPLAIQSTPKPKQTRFYTSNNVNGDPRTGDKNNDDFAGQASLRGVKVYPHQRHLSGNHWTPPANRNPTKDQNGRYREYLKQGNGKNPQKSSQNRSVSQWVNPGITFQFQIYITNLNAAELGGLLWMLSQADGAEPAHFRIGGGKPLGFGSATMRIVSLDIATGQQHAARWRALGTAVDQPALPVAELIETYKDSLLQPFAPQITHFEQLPMIAAWLQAARGKNDQVPYHYPRQLPEPQAEQRNFDWFGANLSKALPSLLGDDRLDY